MHKQRVVRPSAVAGMFYPEDEATLRAMVRSLLADKQNATERVLGLIVPHAGYRYSGDVAASAYGLIQEEDYATVVIVSPSHREFFEGISVFPGDAYSTPLGEIEVDAVLREDLVGRSTCISETKNGPGDENGIEVQIPFLQETLHRFMILPVVIGDQRRQNCEQLGDALGEVCRNRRVLLVASTDLSHYHSENIADRLDSVIINDVRMFDDEQ